MGNGILLSVVLKVSVPHSDFIPSVNIASGPSHLSASTFTPSLLVLFFHIANDHVAALPSVPLTPHVQLTPCTLFRIITTKNGPSYSLFRMTCLPYLVN